MATLLSDGRVRVDTGDNLSAIGKKFGVDYNKITGYRSGNPNLIYAGEVLTLPKSVASPTPQVAPATNLGGNANSAIKIPTYANPATQTNPPIISQGKPLPNQVTTQPPAAPAGQQYVVKSGDSISAIAKKLGVTADQITGYKSGNPNLIYPGETLSIGGAPQNGGTGQQGIWIDSTTGLGYSGPKKNTNDQPADASGKAVPPAAELPAHESSIPDGQAYVQSRLDRGLPADEASIIADYKKYGLAGKYGAWKGSAAQYKALGLFEQTQAKVTEDQAALALAQQNGYGPNDQIQYDDKGNMIPKDQADQSGAAPDTGASPGGSSIGSPGVLPDSTHGQLPSTDLASIIGDITSGAFQSPQTALDQEKFAQDKADLDAAATDAMTKLQENLASKGLTFSGIRTAAESAQVAVSLSKMTGLSLDYAQKIIDGAVQEQTRREKAITAAQSAQNDALKAMGYVVDPITGTLQPTLEREKMGQPKTINVGGALYQFDPSTGGLTQLSAGPSKIINAGGNLFQYDPNTGEMTQIYEAPAKEKNLNIQYFTDDNGNVTKIINDPTTGKEISRQNLGDLGKTSSSSGGGDSQGYKFTSTQLNNGASYANLPLDQFNQLDGETKNYFINRGSDYAKFRSDMIDTKTNPSTAAYASKSELKSTIDNAQIPAKVKTMLQDYYNTLWPSAQSGNATGGFMQSIFPWWPK